MNKFVLFLIISSKPFYKRRKRLRSDCGVNLTYLTKSSHLLLKSQSRGISNLLPTWPPNHRGKGNLPALPDVTKCCKIAFQQLTGNLEQQGLKQVRPKIIITNFLPGPIFAELDHSRKLICKQFFLRKFLLLLQRFVIVLQD